MSGNVFDIKTRKPVDKIENADEVTVQQFMKRWAKTMRDGKFKSVFILAIDETDHCTWGLIADNEHHKALACLTLEDLREEIKDAIFGYEDFEYDD